MKKSLSVLSALSLAASAMLLTAAGADSAPKPAPFEQDLKACLDNLNNGIVIKHELSKYQKALLFPPEYLRRNMEVEMAVSNQIKCLRGTVDELNYCMFDLPGKSPNLMILIRGHIRGLSGSPSLDSPYAMTIIRVQRKHQTSDALPPLETTFPLIHPDRETTIQTSEFFSLAPSRREKMIELEKMAKHFVPACNANKL